MRFNPDLTRTRLQGMIVKLYQQLRAVDPMASEAALERTFHALAGEAGEVLGKAKSLRDRMSAVEDALTAQAQANGQPYPFVRDWFDGNTIVYEQGGQLYARTFEVKKDGVSFGKRMVAEKQYKLLPAQESEPQPAAPEGAVEALGDLTGDALETIFAQEGMGEGLIKIIREGQGSSGFWTKEALKRDGPKAWPKGTHMYLDHPTQSEAMERPERSVRTLAGVLEEAAKWMDDGPAGPGLYARARVREAFRKDLSEMRQWIGVSVRAMVQKAGEKIVGILPGQMNSVDFVTKPGAGGQVVEAFESLGRGPHPQSSEESIEMNEQQMRELLQESLKPLAAEVSELKAQVARTQAASEALSARITEGEVREAARALVEKAELPEVAKARAVEAITAAPPLKENGALDQEAFALAAEAAVKRERDYIAAMGGGKITGMGGLSPASESADDDSIASADGMVAHFLRRGYSMEAARRMAGLPEKEATN